MGKHLLTVVLPGIVFFFSLSASFSAYPEENLLRTSVQGKDESHAHDRSAVDEDAVILPEHKLFGLHVAVVGRNIHYRDLKETYQFNPAAGLVSPTTAGWERRWYEKRAEMRMDYDLYDNDLLLLQPGLMLGVVQRKFAASNAGLNFAEEWRTRPSLLWGFSLAAELCADRERGPFLRV
jgi:hypothetical protein